MAMIWAHDTKDGRTIVFEGKPDWRVLWEDLVPVVVARLDDPGSSDSLLVSLTFDEVVALLSDMGDDGHGEDLRHGPQE